MWQTDWQLPSHFAEQQNLPPQISSAPTLQQVLGLQLSQLLQLSGRTAGPALAACQVWPVSSPASELLGVTGWWRAPGGPAGG